MYISNSRKAILKWEMYGILFIVLMGSFLHFIFELSGGLTAVALVGAVNESVWEHLKLGFWPAFIWAIIEFFVFGRRTRNFLLAKGTSITLIAFLITGVYYSSVALGIETLAIDIGNFVVSIVISQVISYRIMLIQKKYRILNMIGVVLIIVNLASFSLLSYYPPRCPLFKDSVTGGYGIIEHGH